MNYYNEFDPNAAAWLRELINNKLIPAGDVDTRSIKDVRADDLRKYTQCHFFAGIGGWSYALQLAGWPADKPVWTGSCPCQCYSVAGKQLGENDERDLWPVFYELIRECRPEYVFGEQVENAIRHGWLDRVYTDLEAEDYTCRAVVLGAHSVNAPHQRQRLYWGGMLSMADSTSGGERRKSADFFEKDGRPDGKLLREFISASNNSVSIPNHNSKRCNAEPISDEQGARSVGNTNREQTDGTEQRQQMSCAGLSCGELAENSDVRGRRGRSNGDSTGDPRQIQAQGLGDGGGRADMSGNGHNGGVQGTPRADSSGECRRMCESQGESVSSLSPWSNFQFIYCRDGKVRRIPAESLFFSVADGVSESMDGCGVVCISEDGGFPLTTQKEGRSPLLKGYGNAIVPQLAAEFITAFMEEIK